MTSPFDKLPSELISHICEDLDFKSLASARLASQALKRTFTAEFLTYFQGDQAFDLTVNGIKRLHGISSSPDLRAHLRNVRLMCVYYHETPGNSDQECTWMDEKQAEQYAISGTRMCETIRDAFHLLGEVAQISLEATVILGRGRQSAPQSVEGLAWRELWARAIQSYRVLMSAIAQSQIKVLSLVIFQDTNMCGIPTNEAAMVPWLEERVALAVRNFCICVTTTIAPVRQKPRYSTSTLDNTFYDLFDISGGKKISVQDPEIDAGADFEGLARLFASMSNLESLSIHLYRTWNEDNGWFRTHIPYQSLLPTLLRIASLPRLTSLTLNGLPIQPELTQEIRTRWPAVQFLTLRNMLLTEGLWDRALEPIMQTNRPLERLRLSNLWRLPDDGKMFLACTNLESPSRRLTAQDYRDIYAGTASEERVRYFKTDATRWHTREVGLEELRKGEQLDFEASASGGIPMANGADYVWALAISIEWGPPP